jgi:transposase
MFTEEHLIIAGKANIATMRFLKERIIEMEKAVLKKAKLRDEYSNLLTVPGIGKILALTIMFETGDIKRFPEAGNYVSYCRCVRSNRISNGKSKGEGNRKNGNKYLSWAFVEAANFAIRGYPYVRVGHRAIRSDIKQIWHGMEPKIFWGSKRPRAKWN